VWILQEQKILLTVKEFAAVSGLGETCIRQLSHVEGFPAIRNGIKILIHRRAADAWLAEQAKGMAGSLPGVDPSSRPH